MKLSIILGTRPEIIKISPIIRALEKTNIDWHIIHTNQHYSENMDKIFFEELNLPKPKYNLNIGSGTHGGQTGEMLMKIEKVLLKENPDAIIVQGDTNTVLAGALVASKLKIDIAHVEAGLRSFDKNMPEEINRVLTDHIGDYLFSPTEIAKNNLLSEGIEENKIFVVGNTIVDATLQNLKIAEKNEKVRAFFNSIVNDDYFLLTLHRAENVDNKKRLKNIIDGIFTMTEICEEDIIFPIHPRTKMRLEEFNLFEKLKNNKKIKVIEPVGYLEFLMLEKNAELILTDSGGVQEEACILRVPCITLRDNTERPETVEVWANILVGDDKEKLIKTVEIMINKEKKWENPFGNGKSGERMVKILMESIMDNI
jgi:UDP-N-acetylglucosamine 2-epimerase (non-hydrolysing)